jgi:glycosyltransferase involved in cell wall biosynthesis
LSRLTPSQRTKQLSLSLHTTSAGIDPLPGFCKNSGAGLRDHPGGCWRTEALGEIRKFPLLYIRLKQNYKPSLARNIGIAFAKGNRMFLDDDALAHPDLLKNTD